MKNYNDSNKNNDIMIRFGESIMGILERAKKLLFFVLNFYQISQGKVRIYLFLISNLVGLINVILHLNRRGR